jgi:IclR family acetate operon transcriptional repressor
MEQTSQGRRSAAHAAAPAPLGTVDKAVDILFHLHGEGRPQGVTAVGRALGLPKSSAHRLLTALGRRGLVERDDRGRYRPGIGLVALGLGALDSEPIVLAARPVLEEAAHAVGETFFLVGARAGRLVVLAKAEGTGFLRAAPRVGSSVPVHATAAGKLFLAFGPEAVTPPEPPYERFSSRTVGTSEQLAAAVARVRRSGIAENRDEWVPGLTVLAAPVRTGSRMHAAIAVAASSQRFQALVAGAVADTLRAAARRVADRLHGAAR